MTPEEYAKLLELVPENLKKAAVEAAAASLKPISEKDRIVNDILEAGRRMYRAGMVASNDGNISARLGEDRVLVTVTGVCKGDMTPEHIVTVDMDGTLVEGSLKPTTELKMHLAAYRQRPDIRAAIHSHSVFATAFAVARLPLDRVSLPEALFALKGVELSDYGTPSTNEIPDAVSRVAEHVNGILLSNHGALTLGADVMEAYYNMEVLEHYAAISAYSRMIGGEHFLDDKEIEALWNVRRFVYGKK